MTLREHIAEDYIAAVKRKDTSSKESLSVLRSEIKNAEIAKQTELDDAAVVSLVQKQVKKLREANELFTQGKREDLVQKNNAEIALLEKYLPAAMAVDELKALVAKAVADAGATSPKDMGKVMGMVMAQVAGRADGSQVGALVREHLASLS